MLGILVAAMPELGFPEIYKNIFYIAAGILLIIIAIINHIKRRSSTIPEHHEVVTDVRVI
jgi:hypothetical protein